MSPSMVTSGYNKNIAAHMTIDSATQKSMKRLHRRESNSNYHMEEMTPDEKEDD